MYGLHLNCIYYRNLQTFSLKIFDFLEVLAGPDGAAEKLSLVEEHLNVPYNRIAFSASQRLPKLIPGKIVSAK